MTRQHVIGYLHHLHRRHPRFVNSVLALAYPFLDARRALGLPGLWLMILRYWLTGKPPAERFPPVERALRRPDGLLAVGGPLTTDRLVAAYRQGIYPWCHIGPTQWRSPAERMVLFLHETHVSKRLRTYIRTKRYRVTFDQAFHEVMRACAAPRSDKRPLTWISDRMIEAYGRLFDEGHAHSVEVWEGERLVAGIYGVAVGRVFFTESMFSQRPNASRIALTHLNCSLQTWGYVLNDVKRYSEFWSGQGARLIPRDDFLSLLETWRDEPGRAAPWRFDETLAVDRWRPEQGPETADPSRS